MDSVLIDIAIGLVLIYACLSLLLMKTQEVWHGGMLRGRVKNLHRLVYEAVGQDKTLREQLYRNPLILALSIGEPARDGHMGARSTGPSAIPPASTTRAPSPARPRASSPSPSGSPTSAIAPKAGTSGAAARSAGCSRLRCACC